MFYSQFILAKKGPLGTIWIAAHLERKLRKNQVADTDIGVSVDSILFPEAPIALRLSSHLLLGVVRIYSKKVNYLFDDCSEALLKVKQAFRSATVDLPPEESTAPYHSITLPETFDLDDFELPDNEIFQGNYVDHHVSTREQITLQDTMDGVVYSTSQFGLDERFGDGDTSQAALDLDEEVFQDKDVATAEDVGVSGGDHDDCMDAATPEIKDSLAGAQEPMPQNLDEDQVEDDHPITSNELHEYAQAPQTPGLIEVPNLSSAREELGCDDHMEVDLSGVEAAEGSKELDVHMLPVVEDDPKGPEMVPRAESPCCSHVTTETEDHGQVTTLPGTSKDNDITASDAAVPLPQSSVGPTTQESKELEVETRGDCDNGQADGNIPEERLDNAHAADKQLENMNGSDHSDIPAPENILSVPDEIAEKENDFIIEATPAKEDAGPKNITGRKRTFTESTLTAESLNSVESVGLIRSRRTADSVPDDDDLLSSILVGRSSFLKMKPTPVLEVASSNKRMRTATRSTASKRKVLMDDSMVLHGDVIRQQLTNTEDIRRVRKKAPCTHVEILMLHRHFLEEQLFKESIFTGMSVELVSLYSEPCDLRGIMVIESDNDPHASIGMVNDDKCSVLPAEEDDNEGRSSGPTVSRDDCEEQQQPGEDQTHELDPQNKDLQGEMKGDDDQLGDRSEMEIDKEDKQVEDEVNHFEKIDIEDHEGGVMDGQIVEDVIEVADVNEDNTVVCEKDLKDEDEVCETEKDCCIESIEIDGSSNQAMENGNEANEIENVEEDQVAEIEREVDNKDPVCNEEDDTRSASDEGIASRDAEMETTAFDHDTGFLNVDDDDENDGGDDDDDDDGTQHGDETRLHENSGWSARTRAVAKYLQTLFDKEAENRKNVLLVNNLLTGKTRKEASRMFFETLVLKTKDYIQVEQAEPFDSISIRPRAKLMKSIF